LDSALLRGADQVPLSNIKRLFRSLYQMDLSETALGHSKLTELLQDPRFKDICSVQFQDRGYTVVPVYLDQPTPLNDNDVALAMAIPQITPRSDTEEKERVNANADTPQQQHGYNRQNPVRARAVPPVRLTPSPPRMIRRSFTMPSEFGVGKEASDEHVKSTDSVFSHLSFTDSTMCSTASGSLRAFSRGSSRMDSGISEDKRSVSPQRGAGAELRARLLSRLSKTEGRV